MNELPWEDGLLERKVESDLKDLLKTVVAFANSVIPGHVATLLIGEKDDGTVAGVTNPDKIQMKVRETCENIYPDIIWRTQVYEKEGKHCVRVEIEYSGNTPHFGSPAWVRRGSSTVKASDEVFQKLIEIRSSKVRELIEWVGKTITASDDMEAVLLRSQISANRQVAGGKTIYLREPGYRYSDSAVLCSVNQFWITLKEDGENIRSIPLEKVVLSFDNENNRLEILTKL
jgi:hypothetical protein